MKHIILLLLAGSVSFHLSAQATQQKNDSVFQIVMKYLNALEGDKIFPMLNETFQKAVPLDKFMATTENGIYPLGKMHAKFESYENGLNNYKALFPRDSLSYSIGVDADGKIAAMFFGPYSDKNK